MVKRTNILFRVHRQAARRPDKTVPNTPTQDFTPTLKILNPNASALPRLPDEPQQAKGSTATVFLMKKRDNPQPKQATVTKYATDRTMNNETAKSNRATTHAICKIREARAF